MVNAITSRQMIVAARFLPQECLIKIANAKNILQDKQELTCIIAVIAAVLVIHVHNVGRVVSTTNSTINKNG
jgi:hypothetical protein